METRMHVAVSQGAIELGDERRCHGDEDGRMQPRAYMIR